MTGNHVQVAMYATETLVICCQAMGSKLIQPAVQIIVQTWQQAHDALFLQPSSTTTIRRKQQKPVHNNNSHDEENNMVQPSTVCVRCASAIVDLC